MKSVKQVVMAAVIVVAVTGVYTAVRNLPIVSGCGFYGECPQTAGTPPAEKEGSLAATPLGGESDAVAP